MNLKDMINAALGNAYIDRFRENSDYNFTEAEKRRWEKACDIAQERLLKFQDRVDAEDLVKIYGD
jgi:hypothetical protein